VQSSGVAADIREMPAYHLSAVVALALNALAFTIANQGNPDPGAFATRAVFAVDDDARSLSSVAATLEPRPGAPGYSWVRLHFYAFRFTAADIAGVLRGDVSSMDRAWQSKAANPKEYNRSNAVLQLGVDAAFTVWQIDLSMPGHTCTIAPYEPDVKRAVQEYLFDGNRLRLRASGSFVCDIKSLAGPSARFAWDVDLDVPVFRKVLPVR
jgi:hypothetical protein